MDDGAQERRQAVIDGLAERAAAMNADVLERDGGDGHRDHGSAAADGGAAVSEATG